MELLHSFEGLVPGDLLLIYPKNPHVDSDFWEAICEVKEVKSRDRIEIKIREGHPKYRKDSYYASVPESFTLVAQKGGTNEDYLKLLRKG